jgi:hypothetical protein
MCSSTAERWASSAAESGSEVRADAGSRRLHAFDTYGGPLLRIPHGMLGLGKTTSGEEETSGDSTPNSINFTVALISMPAPCTSVS